MAQTEQKPAAKCPGWPHEYFHPQHPAVQARQGQGDIEPICELDREEFLWESNVHTPTTTVAERELHRAELHRKAGV